MRRSRLFKIVRPENVIARASMGLLETPFNPAPAGAEITPLRAADGITLRSVFWPRLASAPPDRGTLLLLQGRAEFVEKYFEIVAELRKRGFAVLAFDWRGQGASDRLLAEPHAGHVRLFTDFRLDYEAARATIPAGERVTVLAHSMGAAVALTGAHEGWLGAERLACINPMVGLSLVRPVAPAKRLAHLLVRAGLGERMVPGGRRPSISMRPFRHNLLSSDPGRYERDAALARALDWQAIGSPTIGWLATAYDAMDNLSRPEVAASIRLPVLMVLSGSDPVCSTPDMLRFAQALPDGRILVLPEARHEILMESDAILGRFWEAFDAFAA